MRRSLPVIRNGTDFLTFVTYSSDRVSQFLNYLMEILLPEVKTRGHCLPVFMKKLRIWQPLANFVTAHKLILPLPAVLAVM